MVPSGSETTDNESEIQFAKQSYGLIDTDTFFWKI